MYLKHFKLNRMPFDQLPNPDFLYLTEQHEEALTRMQLALAVNDSFVVVTGEVGSGKTTLVRKVLSDIGDDCVTAFITHTRLTDVELLQLILVEFGFTPFKMGKSEMITTLQSFVREQHAEGRRVVVVVDEAQNFSAGVLEELRLLTCLDTEEAKAINIVLVGQPQLNTTMQSPDLEQLRQRCRLRFHMHSLSPSETQEYIGHRIKIAAGKALKIFDEKAIQSIFEHSEGIPRLINTLCDTSMIMACVANRKVVTVDEVKEAVEELDWSRDPAGRVTSLHDHLSASAAGHIAIMRSGQSVDEQILSLPSYVVGRADDCSIVLRSKYLSRHHALISHDRSGWSISDLNSTNGILVNGRIVRSWRLKNGDIVDIGDFQLKFSLQEHEISSLGTETEVLDLDTELPDLS